MNWATAGLLLAGEPLSSLPQVDRTDTAMLHRVPRLTTRQVPMAAVVERLESAGVLTHSDTLYEYIFDQYLLAEPAHQARLRREATRIAPEPDSAPAEYPLFVAWLDDGSGTVLYLPDDADVDRPQLTAFWTSPRTGTPTRRSYPLRPEAVYAVPAVPVELAGRPEDYGAAVIPAPGDEQAPSCRDVLCDGWEDSDCGDGCECVQYEVYDADRDPDEQHNPSGVFAWLRKTVRDRPGVSSFALRCGPPV